MDSGPIGVFDSGYGGLTVLSSLLKAMPDYDFQYFGDNARAPYGTHSFEIIHKYTLEAITKLFDMGSPLVILACNTASAQALRAIQQNDLPKMKDPTKRALGVIRPCAEVVGAYTKSGHIGVLATQSTVNSNTYISEIKSFYPDTTVVQEACPMWVPMIENRETESPAGEYLIKHRIDRLFAQDSEIDTVILGCTHYPLIENQIRKFLPPNVELISKGEIVADSLVDYLKRHPEIDERCSKQGNIEYFTSEDPKEFGVNATDFIGHDIDVLHLEL